MGEGKLDVPNGPWNARPLRSKYLDIEQAFPAQVKDAGEAMQWQVWAVDRYGRTPYTYREEMSPWRRH